MSQQDAAAQVLLAKRYAALAEQLLTQFSVRSQPLAGVSVLSEATASR